MKTMLNKIKWYLVSAAVGAFGVLAVLTSRKPPTVKSAKRHEWEDLESEMVPDDYEAKVQALRDRGLVK